DEKLPIYEKYERSKGHYVHMQIPDPSLPFGGDSYKMASVPVVDVSTRSRYTKNSGDEEGKYYHQAYVKTVGDFAKGTLVTQSRINNANQLTKLRATYKRDSLEGDLLGRFEAKHIEVGDVTTAQIPLSDGVSQELGVRITNTDPLRNFSRATTVISGTAIPGWDIELYRKAQYLGIIHVEDDGVYHFTDVTLFQDNNNFRLVFYGPQGEKHEETVFVPYDKNLLSRGDGIYDVSVSFDGQNTYVKSDLKGSYEERGSMNVAALYEKPLGSGITGSIGMRSSESDGQRDVVGSTGVSLMYAQTLLNADVAVDDEGEIASEVSLRRDFGEHELNYTSEWRGKNFDEEVLTGDSDVDVLRNKLSVNGLIPIGDIFSPRYNAAFVHEMEDGSDSTLATTFGLNGGWHNVSLNGGLSHLMGDDLEDDTLSAAVGLSGRKGKNYVHLRSNYEIKPNTEIENIAATYSRDLSEKVDIDLSVTKNERISLVEYQAQLDWQAGFIRISPSVSYNTDNNFFAGINTRFGLTREPISGDVRVFNRGITNNAFASVFVYLDKNGDGEFNGSDEPLPDVVVSAPQNGRRATTNEEGIAFFERMTNLRLTDVFVDKESLPDPVWIPGFEGISILPRQGYVAQVEFPVHMSGELDGVVYAKVVPLPDDRKETADNDDIAQIEPAAGIIPEEGEEKEYNESLEVYKQGLIKEHGDAQEITQLSQPQQQPVPLRNIELLLYDDEGKVEQRVVTDVDGFYYFTQIPPGRYLLMMSEKSAQRKNVIRPKPQPIEITYKGNVIYDHKIYVDTGDGDVLSEIMADLEAYKERHPHIEFDDKDSDLVLSLGAYNSRLLLSLVWYKLRLRYEEILGNDVQPMVPPAESYADTKTGKHILRVALKGKTLDEAYTMCRSLMARDQYCKVEIYPSYMKEVYIKQAKVVASDVEGLSEGENATDKQIH
ncbi:MAG: hypothetical protein KAJ40_06705, partial [Alphaproteobacteria bacterium]|nr:hypothetical protein [Alphaproteobacteria bacterium]